jgi:hypothetical protein
MSTGAENATGVTIRFPANSLLCVDSTDADVYSTNKAYRIDDNSPNKIYINKQRPLMYGFMTRLALTEMEIQYDIPNVTKNNNTITLQLFSATDATPPVITAGAFVRVSVVGNQYYSNQALATALTTSLNANASVIALFGASAFTVSAGVAGGFIFDLTGAGTSYPSGRTRGYFGFVAGDALQSFTGLAPVEYDLLYAMGITPKQPVLTAPLKGIYTKYTTGFAPMIFTPYIDVVSNLLTKNQNVADGTTAKTVTSSKLARIYFANENIFPTIYDDSVTPAEIFQIGSYPFIIRREFKTPKQIQWNSTENVDVVDIQVLDYKGNPLFIEPVDTDENPNPNPNNENFVVEEGNQVFRFTIQITEN